VSSTENNDHEYKSAVRREWTAAAAGWGRWLDTLEADDAGAAVTGLLLEKAGLKPGDSVLDLGAGYGEPGLSAASAVGATGHLTCLDISGEMLDVARARAFRAGLTNVSFVEADIESFELAPASFDVVLSRAAIMYLSDPQQTLRNVHTALRPGGRLSVAVWATPDRVAFATPVPIILGALGIGPGVGGPGPFALGADGALETLVRQAGFVDVTAGTALAVYETVSAEACTEWIRDVAPPINALIADQPESVQKEVWDRVTLAWAPFQTADGTVRLPCTAICVSATKACSQVTPIASAGSPNSEHVHTWQTRSQHSTSEGPVDYQQCPCGSWRILVAATVRTPHTSSVVAASSGSGTTGSTGRTTATGVSEPRGKTRKRTCPPGSAPGKSRATATGSRAVPSIAPMLVSRSTGVRLPSLST
jgi:ubiquinone/menaquinone biosynthesis C-methylase UbiE